ncbi:MAG: hypothetical protein HZB80_00445 [Deltaproteobacteria bacterium]|nr:hypothetical protein [Deltaproteobacteria bacterium]
MRSKGFAVVLAGMFLSSILVLEWRFSNVFDLSYLSMVIVVFIFLFFVFMLGMYVGRTWDIPYITKRNEWSVGIYTGNSPLDLKPVVDAMNPVLSAKDITDIPAHFVADPFMVKKDSKWFMFVEILNARTQKGEIGFAVSDDALRWTYKQIALEEPFHLSYPYVFEWGGEYYMIPESSQVYAVRLYKASNFPVGWSFVTNLLYGRSFKDSSVFRYDDIWWMFTTDRNDYLLLYYSDNLLGPWIEHPKSPVVRGDVNAARPGGRVVVSDNRIIRYVQKGTPENGFYVLAFEVTELTTLTYKDMPVAENPILKAGNNKWNKKGGHTIDAHRITTDKWIACVDGIRKSLVVGVDY